MTNCWQALHIEFSRQNLNKNVQSTSVWWLVMTYHTSKANLEKGSSWPPEAMPNVAHYPKLLVLNPSSGPTPWTHSMTPLGPGASLRPIYYKLIINFLRPSFTLSGCTPFTVHTEQSPFSNQWYSHNSVELIRKVLDNYAITILWWAHWVNLFG